MTRSPSDRALDHLRDARRRLETLERLITEPAAYELLVAALFAVLDAEDALVVRQLRSDRYSTAIGIPASPGALR